jgi:transposase
MTTHKPLTGPTALDTILAEVVETLPSGERTMYPTPGAIPDPSPAVPNTGTAISRSADPEPPSEYALLIAIDWGDKAHDLWYVEPVTNQRTHHTLAHTPNALHAWVQDLHQRYPGQAIAVALEQKTGSLFNFLVEDDLLDLYPVNPVMVAQYRKAFHPSGAKDDPTDAELILDLLTLHRNKLPRLSREDPLTRSLQILTRKRRDTVNLRTKFNNQLKELLKQYFPLFLTVCGEDLFAPMACQLLLKYPCFDALTQADPEELRQFYVRHGCWKPQVIARRLERIRTAQPLTTDAAIIQSAILEATMLAELLLKVGDSIKTYDKTIADRFPQHPDAPIFASFPGAGDVLAPRLLAAFGSDRERFHTPTDVQNTMGISPVKKESGNTKIVQWRKACPKFLRQSFQEYADESIRHSIWARAYYQQQRARGNRHQAAIRALAFKWIRIMFRCWQTKQPYDELQYLAALQRRHAPLLEYLSKSDQVFGT